MIFLNTSSVPPAIRIAVENNNPFWNTLFNTGFFSSRTYPPISIKSNAYDDTSCILDAVTSLLIDNSGSMANSGKYNAVRDFLTANNLQRPSTVVIAGDNTNNENR